MPVPREGTGLAFIPDAFLNFLNAFNFMYAQSAY